MIFFLFNNIIIIGLLLIAVVDIRKLIIPDQLSFLVIGLSLSLTIQSDVDNIIDIILGGVVSFMLFESTRRIMKAYLKRDALGMGDVKLMIGGGLWVGLSNIPTAILIACIGGIIHFVVLTRLYKESIPNLRIPFGPYLVMGLLIVKLPFTQNFLSYFAPF